jgi:hypothetical protein
MTVTIFSNEIRGESPTASWTPDVLGVNLFQNLLSSQATEPVADEGADLVRPIYFAS